MRKLIACIFMAFLFLCLFGCQKTPERSSVIGKSDDFIANVKSDDADTNQLAGISERWEEEFQSSDNFAFVNINANITIPSDMAYPVLYVEPKQITQETADEMLNYFAGDATVYKKTDILTKSEVQQRINLEEQFLKNDLPQYELTDPEYYQAELKSTQESLNQLYQQLESAPLTMEVSSKRFEAMGVDNKFVEYLKNKLDELGYAEDQINTAIASYEEQMNQQQEINGLFDSGKANMANIHIYKYSEKNQGIELYNTGNGKGLDTIFNPIDENMKNKIKVTYDVALAAAQSAITDLQIQDMALVETGYVQLFANNANEASTYVYRFIFAKKVNGIPVIYARINDLERPQEIEYKEPWPDESLVIGVDETGIIEFRWNYPTQIGQMVNDDVQLLPFDEIQKIFKDQIVRKYNREADNNIASQSILINRVTLGLVKVAVKDTNQYMLVPAWDFFGEKTTKYKEQIDDADESNEMTDKIYGHSYMTINAIDGSVIDRTRGY